MNCFSLDIFKFISLLLSFNSLNRMYLMWLCIFLRVEFLRCVGFFNQFEKFSAIMSLNNLLQLHICWYFCYSTSFWDGSFFLIHSSVLQIVSFLWVFFWVHWFFFFSPAVWNLLSSPCGVFFISALVLFNSRISVGSFFNASFLLGNCYLCIHCCYAFRVFQTQFPLILWTYL